VTAGPHAEACLAAAERLRHHFYLARAFVANEWLMRLGGRWQAALDLSDRGLAVSPRETRQLALRTLLEYELGNFSQGEAYLDRLLETMRLTPPGPGLAYVFPAFMIPLVARITGVPNWLEVAEAAAGTVLSSPSVTPLVSHAARTGLALLAVLRGDVAAAGEQYAALEDPGFMIVLGMGEERLLGILAHTMGQLDKAAHHFEDALAFCRKADYRPELAWTCCDYADCLLARARHVGAGLALPSGARQAAPLPGDRAKAMALLDEGLAISRELGMRPLMERVLSRREILTA
jgi:tetratricopeptide (TPR) repeat protein